MIEERFSDEVIAEIAKLDQGDSPYDTPFSSLDRRRQMRTDITSLQADAGYCKICE